MCCAVVESTPHQVALENTAAEVERLLQCLVR